MTQNTTRINVEKKEDSGKTIKEALNELRNTINSNRTDGYSTSSDLQLREISTTNALLQRTNSLLDKVISVNQANTGYVEKLKSNANNTDQSNFTGRSQRTILGNSSDDSYQDKVVDLLGQIAKAVNPNKSGSENENTTRGKKEKISKSDQEKLNNIRKGLNFVGTIGTFFAVVKKYFDVLKESWGVLKGAWADFKNSLGDLWDGAVEGAKEAWNNGVDWVKERWDGAVDWTKEKWNSAVDVVKGLWDNSVNWVSEKWDGVTSWTNEKWNGAINAVQDVWNSGADWVKNKWSASSDFIKEKWNKSIDVVKGLWDTSINTVKAKWDAVVSGVEKKWNGIIQALKGVIEWLKHPIDNTLKWASDTWNKLWDKEDKKEEENSSERSSTIISQTINNYDKSDPRSQASLGAVGQAISNSDESLTYGSVGSQSGSMQEYGSSLSSGAGSTGLSDTNIKMPDTLGEDYGSSSAIVNGIPAVAMKDLGLSGTIASTNSKPYISVKNADNLKILDSSLASWGYDTIYTSAMGGGHRVSPRGHSAGQKVDLQLKKNGKPTRMTPDQEKALITAGFAGSGTGALGWEPVAGQVMGGHYDYSVGGGVKSVASAPANEAADLPTSNADESAGNTMDFKTEDNSLGSAASGESVKMESDTSILESNPSKGGIESGQLEELIAVQRETAELQKKQLNVMHEQLDKKDSSNVMVNNSSNNNNNVKISSNMTSNK